MKQISEYDGKKHYIRHLKTPDHSVKNDCLIRALCEVTGKSYYNICLKLGVLYIANLHQHSVSSAFLGVTLDSYYKAFLTNIEQTINIASDPYSYSKIYQEAMEGKLPTTKQFAKAWSRRKQYSKSKLILHCFNLETGIYHAVYCKNGYYYDSNDSDSLLVVTVDIFR